jgi:ketosteroid isomerase-like protein
MASLGDTSAVDAVRELYANVERGEVESLEERLTDDVVWRLQKRSRLRAAKIVASGPGEVAVSLSANYGAVVADEFVGEGDRVMVVFIGVTPDSGDDPVFWQVLEVRDGKIASLQDHVARDEALAAIGREPSS